MPVTIVATIWHATVSSATTSSAATTAATITTALASSFLFWSANVSSCRAPGGDHQFLAYCTHPWFGDYEHAVYGWGWRPDAVRSAREAEVLFLGSSTSQVAFSSESTRQFFSVRMMCLA